MGFRLSWLYFFTIDALSLWCVNKPCTKVRANSTTEDKRYLLHVKQSSSTTKRSRTISPGQREQAWVEIVEKELKSAALAVEIKRDQDMRIYNVKKKESIVGCSIIAFVDLVFVHKMSNYPWQLSPSVAIEPVSVFSTLGRPQWPCYFYSIGQIVSAELESRASLA